jgi:hypothetical protein
MSEKPRAVRIDENINQTKFACLVAAILTTSVLEAESPSPEKVFNVYSKIMRMIEEQPSIF